jgi:hypothetical protein
MATRVITHTTNSVLRSKDVIESITAAKTLDAADSGKTFILPATGYAISLPALAEGLNYRFIGGAAVATTAYTIVAATAKIQGSIELAGAVEIFANETTLTLVIAKFLAGDFIELKCDGVNWYASGSVVTALGVTSA